MSGAELRREKRDRVTLPVHMPNGCEGITRDLSASGIYLNSECPYMVGREVELSIEVDLDRQSILLNCRGVVVRIDNQGVRTGVAIKTIDSEIQPLDGLSSA